MKLTIAILFCDKDYQHIPFLLDLIEDNVLIKYELILVDNREASKYEYIDFKNPDLELISNTFALLFFINCILDARCFHCARCKSDS